MGQYWRHYPIVHFDKEQAFTLLQADLSHDKNIFERTNFEYYVFEYILNGSGTVIIDDNIKFKAQANDVYIIPKYHDHKLCPDKKNIWQKLFFVADGPVIDYLLMAYKLDKTFLYRNCNQKEAFYTMRESFFSSVDNLDSAVLFHKIIQSLYQCINLSIPQYSIDVFNIKKILDANINKQITLDKVCAQLKKSKASVIRNFKAETGQTPYDYLLNKKLELACKLLCSTSFSIKEIADRLNFADQYYFSDLFKKKIGLSPKYYREESHISRSLRK